MPLRQLLPEVKISHPCECDWYMIPHSAPVRLATEDCKIHGIELAEPTIAEAIRAAALRDTDEPDPS
jgi:hypothetical protein